MTRTSSIISVFLILALLLAACSAATGSPTPGETASLEETTSETLTLDPSLTRSTAIDDTPADTATPTDAPTSTATPDMRLDPADWQNWPVLPTVSARAEEIYALGLQMGNYPNRFSKIGDCQNINTYFLDFFDDPDLYTLGEDYVYLQETLDHFSGSFSRVSVATKGGMNVASVLSHYWADQELCEGGESPLACELRLNQPSIGLISMEESWGSNNKVENYEKYMRQIIETVIDAGVVPILATKADNLEGDHQINRTIANLAYEYDIPLWNFWLAVQGLPNGGLLEDGFHLTHGANDFSESKNLKQAWPVRNLTALQALDSVWRQLNDLPLPPVP
jgi:hypothetical protein